MWIGQNLGTTKDGINQLHTAITDTYPPGNSGWFDAAFASYHPGGCHFLIADGSVHFLSQNMDQNILRSLTTRNGAGRLGVPADIVGAGPP